MNNSNVLSGGTVHIPLGGSGAVDVTINVSGAGALGNQPPGLLAIEYASATGRGRTIDLEPIGGGSANNNSVTITTGLIGQNWTSSVSVTVIDNPDVLPGLLNVALGATPSYPATVLAAKLGLSTAANGAILGVSGVPHGYQIMVTNSAPNAKLESLKFDVNYPPGYLQSLGIDPSNLPVGIKGQFDPDGSLIGLERIEECFLFDVPVQMWPLDPSIKPRPDGSYDEELVLSKVWYKQQDEIAVGDVVVSYDKRGRLQPGDVTRTMTNIATHILDFWGTGVTPGHAYNCADGPLKGSFAPIMDILRMDGALMRSNGTMFRAATNCDVGSIGDRMIHAEASAQNPDGSWTPKKRGQIRFGTRISTPDGKKSVSVMEIAERQGWSLSDDGYMVGKIEGQEGKFPFPYTDSAELPKPEDYILTRSQVTLEEIYLANEWEQIGTRMPAPDGLAGFNPNSTMKRAKPKPNIPPAFADRPDAPTAKSRAQRAVRATASPSAPGMNRKQRKAMEAKQRKADKTRRRAAG